MCGKDRYFRGDEFVFEGPQVNLLQESAIDRVVSYFRKVGRNGMLYGLMRRKQLSTLPFQQLLAGDWLLMSSIAFCGKAVTLDTVSINRSAQGESDNVENLAARMGLPPYLARHPFLVISWNIVRDIGWASPSYEALSAASRFQLAIRAAWGVVSRYGLARYLSPVERLSQRVRRIAQKAGRTTGVLLDRHVLWRFRSK